MSKITIVKYNPCAKGALIALLDIQFENLNMEIRGVALMQGHNGQRWFKLPSKPFTNQEGEQKFAPIVKWTDRDTEARFNQAMTVALDEYVIAHSQPASAFKPLDDIPF